MAEKAPKNKKTGKKPSGLHISLSELLKNIPSHDQEPQNISSLITEEEYNEKCIQIVLTFVQLFNCLEIEGKGEDMQIRAKNESAGFFIQSLAKFVENEKSIIEKWEKPSADSDSENIFNWGISFLYQLEEYRLASLEDKAPFRQRDIFMFVIKAKIKGLEESMYLFQHNDSSLMLQMIGGKKLDTDTNLVDSINRILQRELITSTFKPVSKDSLKKLNNPITTKAVSKKTGGLSAYNLIFYHVNLDIEKLKLSGLERWVSINEIQEGITSDGIAIRSPFENIKDTQSIIEKLEKAELSIDDEQELPIHQKSLVEENVKEEEILSELLNQEESEKLEFKSSLRWDYRESKINKHLEKVIVKSIAGFMNNEGGKLIIGVDDDKKILGLQMDIQSFSQKDTDSFSRFLTNLVAKSIGIEFSSFIKTTFVNIKNKTVCVVEIGAAPQPIFVKDGEERNFYLRSSNSTRPLNTEEAYKYIQVRWK